MGSMGGGSQKAKPTAQERELANIGREKYLDFEQRFVPQENELIAQILQLGTPAEAQRMRGAANVDVMQNRPVMTGLDPTSGRARGLELESLSDLMNRDTAARQAAQIGATQRYTGGLTNAVTLGRNLEGAALKNLDTSAALESSRQLASDRANYYGNQNVQSALGSVAGLGAGLWYGGRNQPAQQRPTTQAEQLAPLNPINANQRIT